MKENYNFVISLNQDSLGNTTKKFFSRPFGVKFIDHLPTKILRNRKKMLSNPELRK